MGRSAAPAQKQSAGCEYEDGCLFHAVGCVIVGVNRFLLHLSLEVLYAESEIGQPHLIHVKDFKKSFSLPVGDQIERARACPTGVPRPTRRREGKQQGRSANLHNWVSIRYRVVIAKLVASNSYAKKGPFIRPSRR